MWDQHPPGVPVSAFLLSWFLPVSADGNGMKLGCAPQGREVGPQLLMLRVDHGWLNCTPSPSGKKWGFRAIWISHINKRNPHFSCQPACGIFRRKSILVLEGEFALK